MDIPILVNRSKDIWIIFFCFAITSYNIGVQTALPKQGTANFSTGVLSAQETLSGNGSDNFSGSDIASGDGSADERGSRIVEGSVSLAIEVTHPDSCILRADGGSDTTIASYSESNSTLVSDFDDKEQRANGSGSDFQNFQNASDILFVNDIAHENVSGSGSDINVIDSFPNAEIGGRVSDLTNATSSDDGSTDYAFLFGLVQHPRFCKVYLNDSWDSSGEIGVAVNGSVLLTGSNMNLVELESGSAFEATQAEAIGTEHQSESAISSDAVATLDSGSGAISGVIPEAIVAESQSGSAISSDAVATLDSGSGAISGVIPEAIGAEYQSGSAISSDAVATLDSGSGAISGVIPEAIGAEYQSGSAISSDAVATLDSGSGAISGVIPEAIGAEYQSGSAISSDAVATIESGSGTISGVIPEVIGTEYQSGSAIPSDPVATIDSGSGTISDIIPEAINTEYQSGSAISSDAVVTIDSGSGTISGVIPEATGTEYQSGSAISSDAVVTIDSGSGTISGVIPEATGTEYQSGSAISSDAVVTIDSGSGTISGVIPEATGTEYQSGSAISSDAVATRDSGSGTISGVIPEAINTEYQSGSAISSDAVATRDSGSGTISGVIPEATGTEYQSGSAISSDAVVTIDSGSGTISDVIPEAIGAAYQSGSGIPSDDYAPLESGSAFEDATLESNDTQEDSSGSACVTVRLPEKYKYQSNPLKYTSNSEVDVQIEASVTKNNCSSPLTYLWYYAELASKTEYDISNGCFSYQLLQSDMFDYGRSNVLTLRKNEDLPVGKFVFSISVYGTNVSDSIFVTGLSPKTAKKGVTNTAACFQIDLGSDYKLQTSPLIATLSSDFEIMATVKNNCSDFTPTYVWFYAALEVNTAYDLGLSCFAYKTIPQSYYNGSKANELKVPKTDLIVGKFTLSVYVSEAKVSDTIFVDVIDETGCIAVYLSSSEQYRSLNDPMKLQLSARFSIEATVYTNCTYTPIYQWYIHSTENSIGGSFPYDLIPMEYYNKGLSSKLDLPETELVVGTFLLNVTVNGTDASDAIYIEFVYADLVASISGGTTKTVSWGGSVDLDGQSLSHDPDQTPEALQFSWSCQALSEVTLENAPSAHFSSEECVPELESVLGSRAGTITIDTQQLQIGRYTFRLQVSKTSRVAYYDQIINVVSGYVPDMEIKCLVNCQARVVPSMKLSLVLDCPGCDVKGLGLQFKWSFDIRGGSDYKPLDMATVAQTAETAESLVVEKDSLQRATSYRARVVVTCPTCAESVLEYAFFTNSPPANGTCSVSPPSGEALVTKFSLACEGWISASPTALSYRFESVSGSEMQLLYYGPEAEAPLLPLSLGDMNSDYNRTLQMQIMDGYGSMIALNLTAQVTPLRPSGNSSAASLFTSALSTIDVNNTKEATQILQSVGSLLNSKDPNSNDSLSTAEASELRKNMVGQINEMAESVSTLDDVIQISEALGTTTEVRDEIDGDTLTQATEVMSKLLDGALAMLAANPESAVRVARSVMSANWNVLYSAKPKTPEVDETPELLTAEAEAEQLEQQELSALSPEEQAYYDEQQKERLRIQREAEAKRAKAVTAQLAQVQAALASAVLSTLAPGENPVSMSTAKGTMTVAKDRPDGFSNRSVSSAFGKVDLPTNMTLTGAADIIVQQQVSSFKENPYLWGSSSQDIGTGVTNISFTDESGQPLGTDTALSMEFISQVEPPAQEVNMTAAANAETKMVYHKVNVTAPNSAIVMELAPPAGDPVFEVFVRHLRAPDNTTYVHKMTINASESENATAVPIFIPGTVVTETGIYYIGLRPLANSGSSRRKRSADPSGSGYSVKIATTGCRAWDSAKNDWVNAGELVTQGTSISKTTCASTPQPSTSAFGCAFIAPPNMIDFSTVFAKFAQLSDNAAVFSVVVSFVLLYLLILIWCMWEDRKDKKKWLVEPLEDNSPEDATTYLVTVETGLKGGSGTKSGVWFTLFGRYGDTGIRALASVNKKTFPTASTLTFLMRTPLHMGPIRGLRLWHDNAGRGRHTSWYVRRVTVDDQREKITSIFECNCWFAENAGDGRINRTFKVTSREERTRFSSMYKDSMHNQVTDSHLWVSIFVRPSRSNFTRAQRLTSAVAILFLSMITSAMFYKSEDNVEKPMQLKLGPFSFSTQELFVSVITVLICLPPSVFIVQIFRRSNRKQSTELVEDIEAANRAAPRERRRSSDLREKEFVAELLRYDIKPLSKDHSLPQKDNDKFDAMVQEVFINEKEEKKPTDSGRMKTCDFILLGSGWLVAILSIMVSAFFVILYSMEWGREKANAWLTAYMLSFLESTFISDPLKVIVVALLITLVVYKDKDKIKEYEDDGKGDEQDLEDLSPEQIERAAKRAQMETRAQAALKELIGHIVFMVLLMMVTYGSTDGKSHNVYKSMHDCFIDSFKDGVGSFGDFFEWMNDELVPNYFVLEDVNGKTLHWRERKFTVDRSSFRVGPARLRQIRADAVTCPTWYINQTCYAGQSLTSESSAPFGPEVIRNASSGGQYRTTTAWSHTPASAVRGENYWAHLATYSGGGYLAKLDLNRNISLGILDELKANRWLDRQTRAVFVEFSIYNPNIQLFAFVTLGAESPPSGGVVQYATVQVLRAYSIGVFTVFNYLCVFGLGVYCIVMAVFEIIGIVRKRRAYFTVVKHWMNWTIMILIVIAITLFSLRMALMSEVMAEMRTNLNEYVQFRRVAMFDEFFRGTLAFLCTLGLVKLLFLLKLNKRIGELIGMLKLAAVPLSSFVAAGFILLMAFTGVTHTWYITHFEGYSTIGSSLSSLVAIGLGDFAAEDYLEVDPNFAGFVFSLFNLAMNIIMLNVLCTILMDAQKSFREDTTCHSDEHLLTQLLMEKIFSGIKKGVEQTQKVKHL